MCDLSSARIWKKLCGIFKQKETYLFAFGLLFFVPVWLWFEPVRIYIGYTLLAIGFLLIIKSLNVRSFAIGKSGLEMCLKEAQEIQQNLNSTLHILVPIIARMAMSAQHQRLVPHRFVYKLLREIDEDRQLSNDEKNVLCEDLKWVLIAWMIKTFQNEAIIRELLTSNAAFQEKNQKLTTGIKNIFDPKQYGLQWARIQMMGFRDLEITNDLNEEQRAVYNSIIEYYRRGIEDLIDLGVIESNFFRTGQRQE